MKLLDLTLESRTAVHVVAWKQLVSSQGLEKSFRTALLVARRQFKGELRRAKRRMGNGGHIKLDNIVADSENDHSQQCHCFRTFEERSRDLELIEKALKKLVGDGFGICEGCEGVIGMERLNALLWAPYCIVCANGSR